MAGPFYVISPQFTAAILIGVVSAASRLAISFDKRAVLFLCCFLSMSLVLVFQTILYDINFLREFVRFSAPFFISFMFFSARVDHSSIRQVVIRLTLIIILIDFLLRVRNPVSALNSFFYGGDYFYNFKTMVIPFFIDTNHVALVLLLLLGHSQSKRVTAILVFLLVFTFSRAAAVIFTYPVIRAVLASKLRIYIGRAIVVGFAPIIMVFLGLLEVFFGRDESGSIKIKIIDQSSDVLSQGVLSFFFGQGAGLMKIDGHFTAHNLFGYMSEVGVLGIMILSLPIFFSINSRRSTQEIVFLILSLVIFWISLYPLAYMFIFYVLWMTTNDKATSAKA